MNDNQDQSDNSGHRKRIKDKYLNNGRDAFAEDYEFLELLLTYAIPRRDTKPMAKALLAKFGSIRAILSANTEDLCEIDGIKDSSVLLLHLIKDFNFIISKAAIKEKNKITNPKDLKELLENGLKDLLRNEFGDQKKEFFVTMSLDARNQVLDPKVFNIHKGTVDQAAVYPREIIEYAIKWKASRIVIIHNHPSGFAAPSASDLQVTSTIKSALKLLNIDLLDHIIIAGDELYSLQEHNQM
jgi:DNA repair protein RadC